MKRNMFVSGLTFLLIILLSSGAIAEHGKTDQDKNRVAIVLASFGTTVPSAIESITNIQQEVKKAFPGIPVKITFTSNIIRSIWKKRQAEARKMAG